MDTVADNLKYRAGIVLSNIKTLALERFQLTKRIEEIDKLIGQYEAVQEANRLVQRDIDLRETIAQAQKENKTTEVK